MQSGWNIKNSSHIGTCFDETEPIKGYKKLANYIKNNNTKGIQ